MHGGWHGKGAAVFPPLRSFDRRTPKVGRSRIRLQVQVWKNGESMLA